MELNDIKADEVSIELIDEHKNIYRAQIRLEVAKFAIEMETVLQENDHKTGWDRMSVHQCMSVHQLFSRIKGEFEELQREYILQTNALDGVNRKDRLRKEAIDVANFCMFLSYWTHKNDPVDEEQS